MYDNHNIINTDLSNQQAQVPPTGYPEAPQALLRALFGAVFNGYLEVRLISRRGKPPIQRFFASLTEINWSQLKRHNEDGYDVYFTVCLRKTMEGGKASVASVPTLWADMDGKDFGGGKSEAWNQLKKLPPYLFPSMIVDTGHGYHSYWLLREPEEIEADSIPHLEGYMKGLGIALNADRAFDLSRVLRLPGLLNLKDAEEPRLCCIAHWQPDRRFNLSDFEEYWAETMDQTEAEKPRRFPRVPMERSEEFNTVAVRNLIEHCAFIRHCRDDAAALSEPDWWVMVHLLAPFGEAGKRKIHQLSRPYPKYTETETEKKIRYAEETFAKGVSPHTCKVITEEMNFVCPEDCWARGLDVASPAGMASKLASEELAQQRTSSITISTSKRGKQEMRVNCPRLAQEIMEEHIFRTYIDTKEILVYQDGVYCPRGEVTIESEVQYRLLDLTTTYRVNEVVNYIKIATYTPREAFNTEGHILNLKNGLLDFQTMELKPHSPAFLSTIRLPITNRPDADCPEIRKFLREVLHEDDIPIIVELIGYCLEPSYHIHRAFLFIGDGANGKSTAIELIRAFLGKENCSTLPLQAFDSNRFATSNLFGKLANLYADVPSTTMKHVGTFKMLTGGDSVSAEKKFKDSFSFTNHAKLIFSTNMPPKVSGEDSLAFWRRWIIINFPHQFVGEMADKRILKKLTTDEELSGLLNLALEGLRRLHQNEDFSSPASPEETAEKYLRAADPVYAFVNEVCVLDPEGWSTKDELYDAYKRFCRRQNMPTMGKESFGRALRHSTFGSQVKSERRRIEGLQSYGWKGIWVSPFQSQRPSEPTPDADIKF